MWRRECALFEYLVLFFTEEVVSDKIANCLGEERRERREERREKRENHGRYSLLLDLRLSSLSPAS